MTRRTYEEEIELRIGSMSDHVTAEGIIGSLRASRAYVLRRPQAAGDPVRVWLSVSSAIRLWTDVRRVVGGLRPIARPAVDDRAIALTGARCVECGTRTAIDGVCDCMTGPYRRAFRVAVHSNTQADATPAKRQ